MGISDRQRATFLLRLALLAAVGIAALSYLFVMQRGPVPLRDTYRVRAIFTQAGGVVAGLGQPVNVAGVKVGTVVDADVDAAGNVAVTMEIERDELREVRADARATLEPITPLKDMQIELSPGTRRAPVLRPGQAIPESATLPPTELATLLSALDGDTRAYFGTLMRALQTGTAGRALNMRLLFGALGPTTRQAREVSAAIADRRRRMARLVTNLAKVTRAAGRDRQLASVVSAGNATLQAVAGQDAALRRSLDELPATLRATRSSLASAAEFSARLDPALRSVTPAVAALPRTFRQVTPFAKVTSRALEGQIRPFIREAQPLTADLGPAVRGLSALSRPLTTVVRTTNYVLNELAYNPPGGYDEGNLFWLAYFFHNFGSAFSLGDAHGTIGSAMVVMDCSQATASAPGALIALLTGAANACTGKE
jgi:phospholipid/cholesterol/gamma-HCH transport system substrate-binding protein